jgi:hypothetical protein
MVGRNTCRQAECYIDANLGLVFSTWRNKKLPLLLTPHAPERTAIGNGWGLIDFSRMQHID